MDVVNLDTKFGLFEEHWRPKTIATVSGHELKAVKIESEFPWHSHEVDEMFICWRGTFCLETDLGSFTVNEDELIVVPAGVNHRPVAKTQAEIFLLEPIGTRNTGNIIDAKFTAPDGVRI